MRCVACDRHSKLKDRKTASKCPYCGHRFALNPKFDGVADGFVKKAVDAVSAHGTFRFLPAQLEYEVRRRSRTPTLIQRLAAYRVVLAALVAGSTFMAVLAFSNVGVHFVVYAVVASGTYWAVKKSLAPAAAAIGRPLDPKAAIRRYEAINPSGNKLEPGPYPSDRGRDSKLLKSPSLEHGNAELEETGRGSKPASISHQGTLDRVLVCERPEYRDFYLANDFHLHHACHVMGPDDLGTEDGRNLLNRLKEMPETDIFVVHDATPRGVKFADDVRSDGRWFGGHAGATIFDLGLTAKQLPMFKSMLRPLRLEEIEGVGESVPGLPEGMGADLSLIPPKPLIRLTGASLDKVVALDRGSYKDRKGADTKRENDGWESEMWRNGEWGWSFEIGGDGE